MLMQELYLEKSSSSVALKICQRNKGREVEFQNIKQYVKDLLFKKVKLTLFFPEFNTPNILVCSKEQMIKLHLFWNNGY